LHRLATAFATVLQQRYDVHIAASDWTTEELKVMAAVQSRFLPLPLEG
jgi:lipoate-protein ligase A